MVIQYGRSKLDVVVFKPENIRYLPKKLLLWLQIKYLEYKKDKIIRHAVKLFNGKVDYRKEAEESLMRSYYAGKY